MVYFVDREKAGLNFRKLRQRVVLQFRNGCHHAVAPVTEEDVAKAQADAQKEADQARLEARKDVKNALKQAGADSKSVTVA
jgi:energy-coupling factor transporter ATP-binding protein EcfA2